MIRFSRFAIVLAFVLAIGFFGGEAQAAEFIQGTTGEGAMYEFAVPDKWKNGVLVVWAHGVVSPVAPVDLPGGLRFTSFRDAVLAQGVAVAYSSFSENGFAVKDGEQRTHQLLGLFKSKVGKPSRVYIVGESLGGTITIGLAEKHPNHYDGALPMCGFLGGTERQIAYLANVRIIFDALFPDVLPGDAFNVPVELAANPLPLLDKVRRELIAGFATGKTQKFIAYAELPGITPNEYIGSALTALGYNFIYTNDLLSRTHGRIPFDNITTDYGELNSVVDRFESSPDAMNYIERYETPTGRIEIPVVTLHTSRDPVVLAIHQDHYQKVVDRAGTSEFLRQRTVTAYGHCNFKTDQMLQAFAELRAWVEQGTVPQQ